MNKPVENVIISTELLVDLLRSAADALQASEVTGMEMVSINRNISITDFLRFCLGEAMDAWR